MNDGKIHIPAKKWKPVQSCQPVTKLTTEAYNAAAEICNKCHQSMRTVVSEIIMQSLNLIVYDEEDE